MNMLVLNKWRGLIALLATGILFADAARALDLNSQVAFEIEAQPLATALIEFSKQTQLQVMSQGVDLAERKTPGVKGRYAIANALEQLLAGTGLEYNSTAPNTIAIGVAGGVTSGVGSAGTAESRVARSADTDMNGNRLAQVGTLAEPAEQTQREDGKLEEIVVTAQKRVERLQDVPVPVTALNANDLAASSQVLIRDYYTRIPNLNLTPGTQSAQVLSIRGITTGRGNPTVGIMVDDVPFGATAALGGGEIVPDIDPGDLARIEVLRGPQGTLYGASSMGGLLKFVTVDPSTRGVEGRLQVTGTTVEESSDAGYSVRGAVNIPLSGSAAARLSAFNRRDPGYIDNIRTGEEDINSADAYGGRLSFIWRPSETFSVKAGALLQRIDGNGASEAHTGLADLQQDTLIGSGWYWRKAQAYDVTVNAKLASADFTSISGYSDNSYAGSADQSYLFGAAVQPIFGVRGTPLINTNATRKYTQELRLVLPLGQRVELLAGAFFTHEDSFLTQTILAQDATTGVTAGRYLHLNIPTTYADRAVFTDLTFHLTDRFDVQVGGRQSWLRQTFDQVQTQARAGLPDLTTGTSRITTEPDVFTYLVTPRFRFSPALMLYARMASGYRAGGTNASVGVPVPPSYEPDKTENYEIGLKGSFLDQRLSIDTSLYYIDWNELQIRIRQPLPTGGFINYTGNAGRAASKGVEVSVDVRPWRGLSVQANGVWNDAELAEDFPPDAARVTFGLEGDRLPWSSRWSGSLSLQQEFPLAGTMTGFVSTSISYAGDRKGIFGTPTSPVRQDFPSYSKLDLSLGMRTDEWNASLYATNLTDKRAPLWGGIGAIPPFGFYYTQPRTIGASLTRTF